MPSAPQFQRKATSGFHVPGHYAPAHCLAARHHPARRRPTHRRRPGLPLFLSSLLRSKALWVREAVSGWV